MLESDPTKPFVGLAFKLEDGRYGQLTYMRIYQGTVTQGRHHLQHRRTSEEGARSRASCRMHSDEMNDIDEPQAGDIVALFGVECALGRHVHRRQGQRTR